MDNNKGSVESLLEKATELVRSGIDLGVLKILYKLTELVSVLIPKFVLFIIIAIIFFFLNLGLALWLNQVLASQYSGFFVVALFYTIVALVLYLMRNSFKKRISDLIIKQLFK